MSGMKWDADVRGLQSAWLALQWAKLRYYNTGLSEQEYFSAYERYRVLLDDLSTRYDREWLEIEAQKEPSALSGERLRIHL